MRKLLRIDNSWHNAFCSVDHSTETMLVTNIGGYQNSKNRSRTFRRKDQCLRFFINAFFIIDVRKRVTFCHFLKPYVLDFINHKLRH